MSLAIAGKTAVFVISTLQQIEPVAGQVGVIILCHTRELAYQIKNEYARFSKYLPEVRTSVFYGGTSQKTDTETLKNKDTCPHVVVATPGRLNALVRDKSLNASNVKHFVLDECDKLLDTVGQFITSLRSLPPFAVPWHSSCVTSWATTRAYDRAAYKLRTSSWLEASKTTRRRGGHARYTSASHKRAACRRS